jgi:hypothetical protein
VLESCAGRPKTITTPSKFAETRRLNWIICKLSCHEFVAYYRLKAAFEVIDAGLKRLALFHAWKFGISRWDALSMVTFALKRQ